MAGRSLIRRQDGPYAVVLNPLRSAKNALAARSLVSSGIRVNRQNADQMRRLIQAWQTRALTYYDLCGEIKFAAQFYARMLTPLQLYAGEKVLNDDGTISIEPTQNEVVIEQLERIQDPGGGRNGLMGTYGRLMFLTGEGYLFCTLDEDGTEQWEVLSTDELKIQGDIYIRYRSPTLHAEQYREAKGDTLADGEAIAIRVWQRHPRWSALADSTMFGVLDIVEELLLLTQAVRARAKSRMAGSGILFIDERITTRPPEPVPDEDPIEDPFIADLTEAMTTPIMDEGVATSVVPLVVRVKPPETANGVTPLADLVHHLQVIDPTQLYPETGLRMECLRRVAIGLDMPPEVLLGTADVNHWGGWLVDEQTWKSHGQQKAQQLCDDLTSSFLRPTLQMVKVPDWEKYVVAYDASAVINHPSRSQDAKELYDRRAISKAALRDANAFTDDDEMPEDELAEAIGVAIRDANLAWNGEPTKPAEGPPTPGGSGGEQETETEQPSGTGPGGEKPEAIQKEAPPQRPSAEGEPVPTVGSANGYLSSQIIGASQMALLRAREAAGNRVRSRAQHERDLRKLTDGVPVGQIVAVLGRDRVRALGFSSEADLVAGATLLMEDALTLWQIDARTAKKLVSGLERHAIKTLYDRSPSPLPTTFTKLASSVHG